MKPVRIGLGLRSLRSLRPRPMRYRHKCMAHAGQRGHFRIGEKGTFLLCVYMLQAAFPVAETTPSMRAYKTAAR